MPTVLIDRTEGALQVEVPQGATLLDALRAAGVVVPSPCGGNHSCGKCRVEAEGALAPVSKGEQDLLGGEGLRLACFAQVMGDCRVRLPEQNHTDQIATDYRADSARPDPIYPSGWGVAIDIGTTTVVGYLFSHSGGQPLAIQGEMNRQQAYGADVLTRILYCNEHTVTPLRDLIREQIAGLLSGLCQTAGIKPGDLSGLCITGNTTMLHILDGLAPGSLAMAPFTPQSLFGGYYNLDLPGFPGLSAYLPPCISAYVGADITCSILTSGIAEQEGTVLLVDIGTNGEMALRTAGRLVCCSTAAGPAFEGAGISAGVSAHSGAINSVHAQDGALAYSTIDNTPPVGICGSGLIEAAAAMLELGFINRKGRMDSGFHGAVPIGDSTVSITQSDIRQLQLAKGAIRGGMDTLLSECGVPYSGLERIILCGGFGSYLNPIAAEKIGLIPPGTAVKTTAIGNAAGAGAGRILQHAGRRLEAVRIAEAAQTIDLTCSVHFRNRYIEAMGF